MLTVLSLSGGVMEMPVSFVLFQCCTALSCSVLTLCDLMDCVACQARILEWVAMPSSRESSQPRD